MSLAEIQEAPEKGLILLAGMPGAGKSTFCHQVALNGIAADRPVIIVTSEQRPAEIMKALAERGMQRSAKLDFVDAFSATVGLPAMQRQDTVSANCADLNSLSIAITRLSEKIGRSGTLLIFDSLTSPYLFNGIETVKFIRLFLSRFASEGNSVLALMDEGCGREEDLGAMMSVADGILRLEIKENLRIINVVKHPSVRPTSIEVPAEVRPSIKSILQYEPDVFKRFMKSNITGQATIRKDVGDFVNLFWPNLAHWSGMLWDPKGFPMLVYDLNKEDNTQTREMMSSFAPWRWRLYMKSVTFLQALGLLPGNYSTVKDMKTFSRNAGGGPYGSAARMERSGIIEYLKDVSKTDEHYIRVYENSDCWGLDNVGTTIASHIPPALAGQCMSFEKGGRDWNAVETKCIGLGDPYCEFKLVPGVIGGLRDSLEKDSSVVEKIHERLIERIMEFLLHEKPLVERPQLGSNVHLHVASHAMGFPHLGERYRMAQRMGGAISGKTVGERLMKAGIKEDEVIKRVIDFMN